MLSQAFRDLTGILRAMPAGQALRWYGHVLLNAPTVMRQRKFYPADNAMSGPVEFLYRGHRVAIDVPPPAPGNAPYFAWLREFYVRDCYLGPFLEKGFRYDRCLDIGCNQGEVARVLSILGGRRNHVVAVDCDDFSQMAMRRQIAGEHPIEFRRAYIGPLPTGWTADGAEVVEMDALLQRFDGGRADFMKLDVEGAEFGILMVRNDWLQRVDNIAMEVHRDAGNPATIIDELRRHGFAVCWKGGHGPKPPEDAEFIYASRNGLLRQPMTA
ncbi:FkbM family methyltransferase [Azospirillum sp. TSH100]|uniref:FkbM family methyltransferase n=1 Tax=Azospirillum sp. TSH100 TaxID=652764 RepID=UPI000D6E2A9A|nr:FkbM family methyltransferase [Azospirillum sp. TSH100]QCG87273.1 hypothetical protein E6C72_05735 [Azospirillum sp. TSH100]